MTTVSCSIPILDDAEKSQINDFLEHVDILPLTEAVGEIAILFRRVARKKLPDSIIVATAIYLGMTLVTSDKQLLSSSFQGLTVVHP